jgi:acyl-CoA thioesterase-2
VASPLHTSSLLEALTLEQLDRDLYRGINVESWGNALYGGQVAAQSLAAAAATVGSRLPHSLHGYFLRRGRQDLPVIFEVDRDRDGGSFSSRHVAAKQDGEVIFSMLASFQEHSEEEWPALDPGRATFDPPTSDGMAQRDVLHLVAVNSHWDVVRREGDPVDEYMYIKAAHPLGDDPVVHAAALVYISDLGSGFHNVALEGLEGGGPSVDHSVHFFEPLRADEWVTSQMWPTAALARRGLYHGQLRGPTGELGAVIAQECLLARKGTFVDPRV